VLLDERIGAASRRKQGEFGFEGFLVGIAKEKLLEHAAPPAPNDEPVAEWCAEPPAFASEAVVGLEDCMGMSAGVEGSGPNWHDHGDE
jgi:hypothetical protein